MFGIRVGEAPRLGARLITDEMAVSALEDSIARTAIVEELNRYERQVRHNSVGDVAIQARLLSAIRIRRSQLQAGR